MLSSKCLSSSPVHDPRDLVHTLALTGLLHSNTLHHSAELLGAALWHFRPQTSFATLPAASSSSISAYGGCPALISSHTTAHRSSTRPMRRCTAAHATTDSGAIQRTGPT